jgi:para-aminobenzoate synthetase / 4-amino-4-deoxychorismate lyase
MHGVDDARGEPGWSRGLRRNLPDMPAARFDDLRPTRRRSFALGPVREILVAHHLDEVGDVIEAVAARVGDGGWVAGYVAYDAAPAFDPHLRVPGQRGWAVPDLPLAWFAVSDSRRPAPDLDQAGYEVGPWLPHTGHDRYREDVETIRRLIAAGETYQVNHTLRLDARLSGSVESFYRDLTRSQQGGYGALVDTGRWVVASASPELFFEWRQGTVTMRPMKGTIRRGYDPDSDRDQRRRLEASEKDRAENLMIVDMVRNDLGRICATGSIQVPSLFTTEKYDTVWQMTSTVTGRPRPGVSLSDLFSALFPSASVTGAPKVAAMDVIAGLEDEPRGVYCGAVGYGGPGPGGPEWAFNVAIRTVLVDRERGLARYGTGGGVTWDSTPDGELGEALDKAAVLALRTAGLALVETMRWTPREGVRLLAGHLARLRRSAEHFDVPIDAAEVEARIVAAVEGADGPRRIRIVVERDGGCRAEASELPGPSASPVELALDHVPVDRLDPLLYHKTTVRTVYDAAAARHPESDDVALVNEAGEVTETTIANLLVRIEGRWCTPPVSAGCLPGAARAALLATGEVEERSITVDELLTAEAVERVNALRGREACRVTIAEKSAPRRTVGP